METLTKQLEFDRSMCVNTRYTEGSYLHNTYFTPAHPLPAPSNSVIKRLTSTNYRSALSQCYPSVQIKHKTRLTSTGVVSYL